MNRLAGYLPAGRKGKHGKGRAAGGGADYLPSGRWTHRARHPHSLPTPIRTFCVAGGAIGIRRSVVQLTCSSEAAYFGG